MFSFGFASGKGMAWLGLLGFSWTTSVGAWFRGCEKEGWQCEIMTESFIPLLVGSHVMILMTDLNALLGQADWQDQVVAIPCLQSM